VMTVSVSFSVCLHTYLKNHTYKLYEIFYACRRGRGSAAIRYVLPVVGDVISS